MKTRTLLAAVWVFVLATATTLAQTSTDPNEGSQITQNPTTGAYTFSWWGRAGRTYFIQQSDDLINWTYLPVIESGAEQVIQWGFTSTQARFFLRLKYSDIPTNDPFDADFDGDGVSNWDELLQGTDPLVANVDANGLPLDWETFYGIAPGTDPTSMPDGDGLTLLQKYQQGIAPGAKDNPAVKLLVNIIVR